MRLINKGLNTKIVLPDVTVAARTQSTRAATLFILTDKGIGSGIGASEQMSQDQILIFCQCVFTFIWKD
jgi:hypothetical protein